MLGSYAAPPFDYGDVGMDEVRGEVVIAGLSAGRIPWPVGKRGANGARALVVYAGLAEAVRQESATAVCHWWGVTAQTVSRWRREMGGVDPLTEGAARLRSQSAAESPLVAAAREAAKATANDPGRVRRIRESKLGQARPRHVIDALRAANLGRERSAETKGRMSAAKQGKPRPPRKDWTPGELALLGQYPDAEVARRTGRTYASVGSMRLKLGRGRPVDGSLDPSTQAGR